MRFAVILVLAKVGSVGVPDVNVILNVACVLLLVVFGPRYLKTRDLQAQIAAKDKTIATDKQTITSREDRIESLVGDLAGVQERAQKTNERCRKYEEIAHKMQGRYEEQSKYTAKEALRTLSQILSQQGEEAERRHKELMSVLETLPSNGSSQT